MALCKDPLLPRNEKQKSFPTSFRLRPSKSTMHGKFCGNEANI